MSIARPPFRAKDGGRGGGGRARRPPAPRAGGIVQGAVIELPNNYGYIGYLIDTEGNRVGLHSLKCS